MAPSHFGTLTPLLCWFGLDSSIPPLRVVTADRGDSGLRIDLVLRRHLSDVRAASRTRVQAWIEGGQVTVNGTITRRVSVRAAIGDVVTVALPQSTARQPMAQEDVPLRVLHEDDSLLIVDKPAGIVVHPTHQHAAGTLMNALLWYARAWPAGARPSIVGRLDKLTSGLVIVAKSAATHAAVQREWGASRTVKDYLALVYGRVGVRRGEIELRLRRDPSDRRRVVASPTLGAPSVTRFERVGSVRASRVGLSLLRCKLVTGRTHQIRVHLAARGWPIVGDPVYGQPLWRDITDERLAAMLRDLSRQALHAWRVELKHPSDGRLIVAEAPVPADLAATLECSGLEHTPHIEDGENDRFVSGREARGRRRSPPIPDL
jgi:23S rRNA pseudouridine1911/1915/1917 synthase